MQHISGRGEAILISASSLRPLISSCSVVIETRFTRGKSPQSQLAPSFLSRHEWLVRGMFGMIDTALFDGDLGKEQMSCAGEEEACLARNLSRDHRWTLASRQRSRTSQTKEQDSVMRYAASARIQSTTRTPYPDLASRSKKLGFYHAFVIKTWQIEVFPSPSPPAAVFPPCRSCVLAHIYYTML